MRHEIRDPLEHAAGLEDEGGEGDAGEVGAGPELGDDVGEDVALFCADDRFVFAFCCCCFFCAGAAGALVFAVVEDHFAGGWWVGQVR